MRYFTDAGEDRTGWGDCPSAHTRRSAQAFKVAKIGAGQPDGIIGAEVLLGRRVGITKVHGPCATSLKRTAKLGHT